MIVFALGCALVSDDDAAARLDSDGDGVAWPDDCDPGDPAIGVLTWYQDADKDGFGDPETATVSCTTPPGFVALTGDCDDGDDTVNPDQPERCDDGSVDDDCDGAIDDDDDAPEGTQRFWPDGDGDTHGAGDVVRACAAPPEHADNADDCDDDDVLVHPGAGEVCGNGIDDDCDGDGSGCRIAGSVTMELSVAASVVAASGGDVTGDGVGDVIVGKFSPSKGRVHVFAGPHGPGTLDAADAMLTVDGPYGFYQLGNDLTVGDVDGDGVGDLVMGASDSESGAHVLLGPITAQTSLSEAWTLAGPFFGFAGETVEVGHLDDDVREDIVVGAPHDGFEDAVVYVVAGRGNPPANTALDTEATAVFTTTNGGVDGWATVHTMAAVGDMTGDGVGDLVLGDENASGDAGAAFLFAGPHSGTIAQTDADGSIVGVASNDAVGSRVSPVGDLDGDGLADVLVCDGFAPACYLVRGPLGNATPAPDSEAVFTGSGAVGVASGDYDGDGLLDPTFANCGSLGQNICFVWGGPLSGSIDLVLDAVQVSSGEGMLYVAAGADLNDDGVDEVIAAQRLSGPAYILFGKGI